MQSEKKSHRSGIWIECWIKNPEWVSQRRNVTPLRCKEASVVAAGSLRKGWDSKKVEIYIWDG